MPLPLIHPNQLFSQPLSVFNKEIETLFIYAEQMTALYNLCAYYAAVLIGRIAPIARPSVRPSVCLSRTD